MNEAEVNAKFERDVQRDRVKLLYDQVPFALMSNFVISVGLVALLWRSGQETGLLIWLMAVVLLVWGRWLLRRKFLQTRETDFDAVFWGRRFILSVMLAGGLLGFLGVWFFPESNLSVGEMALVLLIMSLGSIMLHAAYRKAHVAYVLLALLPFVLRCFWTQDGFDMAVGMVVLLFIPLNLHLAKKMGVSVVESIHLRLRNQVLIAELTQQKEIAQCAQNQAEQASRDKTRFLVTASHDLRQPVQALEFFSAALSIELQGHTSRALVDNIRATGRELGGLLDALLDLSQTDSSIVQPKVRDFPMADLMHRLSEEFSIQSAVHGLHYRVVSSQAWVRSDPVLLERILRNLLTNAVKYTRTGKILLGCRRVADGLRIEVHDTGVGIAQEQQAHIFGEFIQLDNMERDRRKGLGLGLAIVDNLAKALGHRLTLRSTPGRGSVFGVTVALGEPQTQSPETDLVNAENRDQDALIVLVDDDIKIRESTVKLLENWGYAVIAADSAADALALLQASERQPDVLLVDHRLREERTGLQAIHDIRAYYDHPVPSAILTGDTGAANPQAAQALGIPLLSKPLPAAKLRRLVINLLRT